MGDLEGVRRGVLDVDDMSVGYCNWFLSPDYGHYNLQVVNSHVDILSNFVM